MKKEVLERFLRGLGSLFKKRGQYFNPESPDFGELSTLFKGTSKTKPVAKKTDIGPPRDPEVDYETAAALKKSRKLYDLERKNLNPLTKHLEDMVEESTKKLEAQNNELKIQLSQMQEMNSQLDEFNRIADEQGIEEALEQLNRILNPKRTLNADGGRIGKFKGGLMQLLKRVNPALEREMVKTGPFQTGHRGDVVGDMEQIKSLIRNEITDLEEIGKLEDMILESPRYGDQMKSAFMKLIDYEKFRANTIYDNPKLARFIKDDPEGAEEFLKSMYAAAGSESGFNEGGRVKPRTKKADGGITSAADIDYINEATLDAIRDKPMLSRSTRMSNINDALEDLEKYLPKLFEANQGGLTPPQKGPMSEGMGTLYRRK